MFEIRPLMKRSQVQHPTPKPTRSVKSLAVTLPQLSDPGLPLNPAHLAPVSPTHDAGHQTSDGDGFSLTDLIQIELQILRSQFPHEHRAMP
jgi:hypothetical protein